MKRLDTDVLVIGGGLAGLRAAIAARRSGARVLVAVKGKLGRSGSSAMTTAGYAVACTDDGSGDRVGQHIDDTLRGGCGIGEHDLVAALCASAADELHYLGSLGVGFEMEDQSLRRSPSGDHSRPRMVVPTNHIGTDITLPMVAELERLGVARLEFAMAVELIAADGHVSGAICLDTREGGALLVSAGSVILATGGAGRLFPITSNPNDVTGDGFALGWRAGARLRDMEFIQFYPWRCIDPFDKARVSIQPSTFVLGARLYNARGERFMESFNPDGAEVTSRDIAARGIFEQIRQGLGVGGGVRLDLSALDRDSFAISNPKVARHCARLGIDYATYPFVVTPEAHFWMGGLAVDSDGATSIQGLYAVGECAGGVHGANRLNSNALPETLVFGARAGAHAARRALAGPPPAEAAMTPHVPVADDGMNQVELAEALSGLRACAWASLGIARERASMETGLAHVRALRTDIEARGAANLQALRAWHELGFLCDTAEMALVGALHREESRGAHFRDDFPLTDDSCWRGSIVLGRRGPDIDIAFAAAG